MYSKMLVKLAKRTKLLEGNGCTDYEMKCKECPLESLVGLYVSSGDCCSYSLKEYINTKLTPEEKLEFLIEIYN